MSIGLFNNFSPRYLIIECYSDGMTNLKIDETLPQFHCHRALMLVADKQEARVYTMHDGYASRVLSFHVSTKRLEMLQKLSTYIPSIISESAPTKVFLFAPSRLAGEIIHFIPSSLQKSLVLHYGIYTESHPFELLQLVHKK